jgi:Ni,Fe-hydrogenase III small subunit
VFAQSFVCANGVAEVLPVDVEVPGNPPPPLAILHGLLVAVGRKPPQVPGLGGHASANDGNAAATATRER